MKPGEREKQMLSELGLSASQKHKTDALIDEMAAKAAKMRPAGGGRPSPADREKFMALRKEYHTKIEKVLTPAQAKKLDAMEAAMRAKWSGRGRGGPGGPGAGGPGTPPPPKP
jgi:hypothetical protein